MAHLGGCEGAPADYLEEKMNKEEGGSRTFIGPGWSAPLGCTGVHFQVEVLHTSAP